MKTSFLTVVSVLSAIVASTSAFATGENTVTSKSYVDAMDATKQNIIPATGTNASTPGSTVVTYTGTAGTIGERDIYDGSTTYNAQNDANSLITAGDVMPAVSNVPTINHNINAINQEIYNINNTVNNDINNTVNNITNMATTLTAQSLQSAEVSGLMMCANADCTLWQVPSRALVHGLSACRTVSDCPACDSGFMPVCGGDRVCHCVYGACNVANDCPDCESGATKTCESNVCRCVYGACSNISNCPICPSGMEKGCTNGICTCSGNTCIAEGMMSPNANECCSRSLDQDGRCAPYGGR